MLGSRSTAHNTRIDLRGTVHGTEAIRFDGGVPLPSGTPTNICALPNNVGPSGKCSAAVDSYSPPFDPSRAIDTVIGGATPNRWVSSDSSPYHWFTIYLGSPHFVSAIRAWSSGTSSTSGKLCGATLQYMPFQAGQFL